VYPPTLLLLPCADSFAGGNVLGNPQREQRSVTGVGEGLHTKVDYGHAVSSDCGGYTECVHVPLYLNCVAKEREVMTRAGTTVGIAGCVTCLLEV
jgi:hypothetical protein